MRNIYYISGHFTDLLLYCGLCSFFRKFFPEAKQHLVLAEHPMFSRVNYDEFLEGFDSVRRLPYCECAYTNRWRTELHPYVIYGRLARVRAFIKEARRFTFEEGSLCFVSDMSETALGVRFLLKKIRTDARHSVICRMGTCYHRSDECRTNNWISWLLHNAYALIGAYPVSVYLFGWIVADRRFYREKKVMDYFLVYSNKWKRSKDYIEIKYPLLDDKQPTSSQVQRVFFFDSGPGFISLFPEMSRERYIATMNQVLQALTDLYKNEDVDLLLKPHPRQEEIPYDLAGFDIYNQNVTAEMLYTQHRKEIQAVYSVTSNSTRTASLFGIDSYVFYELFGLPKRMINQLEGRLLDFSDVVSIRSLDELRLPQPKAHTSPSTTDQDLERLAQLFREVMWEGTNV